MPLTIDQLLGIKAEISAKDPILQRVTDQAMVEYLQARGFAYAETTPSGMELYAHPEVTDNTLPFEAGFYPQETDPLMHITSVKQFIIDMQRFYAIRQEPQTQLHILNDLL